MTGKMDPPACALCGDTGFITSPEITRLVGPGRCPGEPVKCLCVIVAENERDFAGKINRGGPHESVTDAERDKVIEMLGRERLLRIEQDYLKIGSIRETARAHGLSFERVRAALRICGYVLGSGYRKWAGMSRARSLRN
jgi:hypothetical protein